jgi:hypothetical protein
MKCTLEMGSGGMIYTTSIRQTGTGVEGILRFCLSNMKGCSVASTDGKDL